MSFRTKLVVFALTLIAILALPLAYFQVQRPWRQLYALIDETRARLDGVECAFNREEITRVTRFALRMAAAFDRDSDREYPEDSYPYWASSQGFYLLLDEGSLPSQEEVLAVFEEEALEFSDFDYGELEKWYRFWQRELDGRPGLEALFRRYRTILIKAQQDAVDTGFQVANVYLMADTACEDDPFFKENVAIVLESLPWWEASYPGEAYDLVESDTMDFRESYVPRLGGKAGFHHNRVFDPDRWYLPQFDIDQWGTWFCGWKARELDLGEGGIVYATLNIDFDAVTVKDLMFRAGVELVAVSLVLVLILVSATKLFGRWLTRPILALTRGAEAVIDRKYDHVVPRFGKDEFDRLITVFNRMIRWVGEMTNLKETLTKLLSEELAESAAKEGLMLGGQEVECTIMFTDFAGFSTLTSSMSASEVVEALNLYFGELIPIIKKRGGFPDKYIGDAIVAIFGAPVRLKDHAERAVRCAVELQKRLREINEQRRRDGLVVFEMRIGVNTGEVVAGAIGCDLKLEFTSIGETTNLANRMEAMCDIGQVLLSEHTYFHVAGTVFEGARIDSTPERITVKGYQEPVTAHRVYIHDLEITKNMEASTRDDFYTYEPVTELADASDS